MAVTHARLGASSSHRWMNCPGSVQLSAGLPEVETDYQREGTAAHELVQVWLTAGEHAAQNLEHAYVGGSPEPITEEMRQAAELFVATVRAARSPGSRLLVEQTFNLGMLRPPEPMFGTADAVIIDGRSLHVLDFKYGQGVVVNVQENPQLLYYAVGAALAELSRLIFDPATKDFDENVPPLTAAVGLFDKITVTIVQPRAPHTDGPVRSVEIEPAALLAFGCALLERAEAVRAVDAPLVPGEWCRFCPAQGHCPALQKHAQLVAQVDFDAVPVDMPLSPETISIERAADLLTKVQVLKVWMNALMQRVTRELEAGRPVPGWKLVNKRAQRVWGNPQDVEEWCRSAGLKPADFFEPRTLKSPAQLEKVVGKKNLPEELYVRVSSGVTLAPESDSRPAAAIGPQEEFAALPPAIIEADLVESES